MKIKIEDILSIIRPCGLAPQKSLNISNLSKILVEKHNGNVPGNFIDLENLPGVGHKTASVVMSQGFGHAAFPVDTHIHRLAQRWGLTKGKNVSDTEKDLKKLFPKQSWNKLHLQIIFYGRSHCTARGCDGTICEICKKCYPKRKKAFKTNKA
jgi:endonuclease-3